MRRLIRLFRRYRQQHGVIPLGDFALTDAEGQRVGHIDRCEIGTSWVQIIGWTMIHRVTLEADGQIVSTEPQITRRDVTEALALDETRKTGFVLRLDQVEGHANIWFDSDDGPCTFPIPGLTRKQLNDLNLALVLPFLRDAIRALPAGLDWYRKRDKASANRLLEVFGISTKPKLIELDTGLFAEPQMGSGELEQAPNDTPVTIILPVFNAMDLLPEVLDRVRRHTDLPYHLILVEDCSTDARVRPWLRTWHAELPENQRARVTLLENDSNLGFVGTVNRALDAAVPLGHHVILLNSDAFVPDGWARRLLCPMLRRENVASVTPFSNDAEIFTAPQICVPAGLAEGAVDALDTLAQTFSRDVTSAPAPTGVGFCMAMHIEALRAHPRLDETFGRGYGEEVDWCQKTRAEGWQHLGHAGVFVEHRGGESFGSEEKQRLIQHASSIIAYRYPRYDEEVQAFIRNDPLITPRLALGLALAGQGTHEPVPVYLAHDMGGGAETYLQNQIETDIARGLPSVVLRIGGITRWEVELHSAAGLTRGACEDTDFAIRLIGLLPRRRMIYSCGVGDRNPVELPALLRDLSQGEAHRLEVLFHDYFALSPSFNLLNSAGVFDGVPSDDDPDPAHHATRADGSKISLRDWRAAWGGLLHAADKITVFSESSRDLVLQAYPDCATALQITPHALPHAIPRVTTARRAAKPPVIGVLGSIGYPKGIAVLSDLSHHLAKTGRARLVILGIAEERYPLASSATVHGPYAPDDIPALVARYGISRWFVPSICPETFSYTTHECIATGLPVFSFALGAQGDAVAKARDSGGAGDTIALGTTVQALADHLLKDT